MLVGGKGTRLRPLTLTAPKPMLPTAGVPFLTHQLAQAREAGVDHVVLATSYRAEMFEQYFGDGSALGLDLEYVTETEPMGTGGGYPQCGCAPARGRADSPVLVFNGDVLSGHDIGAQLALHAKHDAAVTLYLTEVEDPRAFGCVPVDAAGRVLAFLEKMPEPVTNLINAGCYVFRRDGHRRNPLRASGFRRAPDISAAARCARNGDGIRRFGATGSTSERRPRSCKGRAIWCAASRLRRHCQDRSATR